MAIRKKKTIAEKRIDKNERKKLYSIIKSIVIMIYILIMFITMIFKKDFEINNGFINKIFLKILEITSLIFGNMLFLFILSLVILAIIYATNTKIKLTKKISYILFFSTLSSINTIKEFTSLDTYNIFEAGQQLLAKAFEFKGAGLYGAIISIPMYKFIDQVWYVYALYGFTALFLFFSFNMFVKYTYLAISSWIKYLNSDEYKKRQELKRVKKQIERENIEKEKKEQEQKFKNIIINKTNENIDKQLREKPKNSVFVKTEYYTEEEFKKEKEKWNNHIIDRNKTLQEEDKKRVEEIKKIEETARNTVITSSPTIVETLNIINNQTEINNQNDVVEVNNNSVEKNDKQDVLLENNTVEVNNNSLESNKDHNIYTIEQKPVIDKTIITQEIKERLDKELKNSIDEIFTYKKVNEEEKEKLKAEISENILNLETVLKDYGVDAEVVEYVTGPTITRYEITIPTGVRVNKVTQLADEIAMKLKAKSIRFEAPIPGKGTIGIETPNKTKETVYFSNIIHNEDLDKGNLNVVLGKNIVGKDKIIDIAKMPHLLIAGQTGSGKSVAINTIISSLISKKSKDEVKFILVDPKMVELMPYNGIPHLLVPVIIEPEEAAIALKWAVSEMENRYRKLAQYGVRNITSYNNMVYEKMPYLVVIIDELADLMMVSANTVETSIARIAQKARAVGIHLIVATQRPSTDVITGMIKANLPSRISFAVRSQIDSRTILDQMGAEKLVGMGDMFVLENGSSILERVQGAYISDEEVVNLTNVLKSRYSPEYNMEILEPKDDDEDMQDPLYKKAIEAIETMDDKIIISKLQTKLKIGFNRATRICEELRKNGIIDENNYKIEM